MSDLLPVVPLKDIERAAIEAAFDVVGPRKKRVAAALGISTKALYDKLNRYGLAAKYIRPRSRKEEA